MGALGETLCEDCTASSVAGVGPDAFMPPECRKCHYPLEDHLSVDILDCIHGTASRCLTFDRNIYNFNHDVYGILTDEAQVYLASAAATPTDDGDGYDADADASADGTTTTDSAAA